MTEQQSQAIQQPFRIDIPEIRKITLALDGSNSSLRACEATAVVTKAFSARVTAVCVLPKLSSVRKETPPDEFERKSLEVAMSMLTSYEGVVASSEILQASSLSVPESLIDYVTKEKSDLVICGHRGLGGFRRLLLGNVSGNLVTHSPVSVMVVRKPEGANGKTEFKRILAATDGSESASKAVGLAIKYAKALSSKLTFANIVYLPPFSYSAGEGSWFDRAMEESRQEGKKAIALAASVAKENGVEAETRLIDDVRSPVAAITRLAEEEGYDLIAVGTRGLGGFKKLALGSVADGVVHYAHCSVLVAK